MNRCIEMELVEAHQDLDPRPVKELIHVLSFWKE
jgi:hypothetical protein